MARPVDPSRSHIISCSGCGQEMRSYKSDPTYYCSRQCKNNNRVESAARLVALEKEALTYFTGNPCKNGHIADRRVDNYGCIMCASDCAKAWAKNNPDNVRMADQKWKNDNKEIMANNHAGYYRKNRQKLLMYTRLWRIKNPENALINNANRRARLAGGKLSHGIKQRLFVLQRGRCTVCRNKLSLSCHLDHIYPLSRGGSNTDDNVQLLCRECNQQKHAKHPITFMQSRGYLL